MATSTIKAERSEAQTLSTGLTYQKSGGMCEVRMDGVSITSTGAQTLGTLPAGYRPTGNAQGFARIGEKPVVAWITSAGVVNVTTTSTGTLAGFFCFVINN